MYFALRQKKETVHPETEEYLLIVIKPLAMYTRFTLTLICLIFTTAVWSNNDRELNDAAITERIERMESEIVRPRYDNVVRSYLRTYTILDRGKAERILGHQLMYFPIFEEYLDRYNLPDDLKYLAVVESGLIPDALSRAGAKGLWQFMERTGEYFGLTVDDTIDERCDVYKSTKAAMEYLDRLYKRFDDWELAIAAYNSGGGRVSRAMKRARSKDFWTVKNYLPRETRNYVPAFIAATYLMKYYEAHDLEPRYPHLDMQLTGRLNVQRELHFYEVAQATGLPIDLIEYLNPAYRKGFIPNSRNGMPLVVPQRVMDKMQYFLDHIDTDEQLRNEVYSTPVFHSVPGAELDRAYAPLSYILQPGQTMHQLALSLGCTVQQLFVWNQITPEQVRPGMELIAYRPQIEQVERERASFYASTMLPGRAYQGALKSMGLQGNIYEEKINRFLYQGDYLFFWVERDMNAHELSEMLPGISIHDIMRLNGFESATRKLKPDDKVKIKRR